MLPDFMTSSSTGRMIWLQSATPEVGTPVALPLPGLVLVPEVAGGKMGLWSGRTERAVIATAETTKL